ncbi:hypothetical protein RJ640_005784 [Escallonia rubra]|uniref:Integrase zinc-binding domain-containing protein n=1 Tax=Escallonia rubra TaxID=112253 RepID=A0AA88QU72_9ASTE|nr:hypothetical protein RJ640_005784 [Escallonia rubra]
MAGKDTSVEASGVAEENVVMVEHGRDPLPPAGGKKGGRGQSKSRDELASLDGRTGHLGIAMGDVKDHVGMVEQNLQTLEDHVFEELESLKKAVGAQDELHERFTELFTSLQEQLDVVKVGVEEIRQDAAMCKRAIEFTTRMLHIPNMAEEDLLFNFVDGLQSWAKKELQRRGVKDVDEAIAMAESLTEYDRGGESSKPKWEDEASEGNRANSGGESHKAWHKGDKHASTSKTEGHGKLEERRASRKLKDCFFCGGPHWARDCPRQGKMAALIEEKEKEKAECETVRLGSIQVLNALQKKNVPQVPTGEGQASKSEGLLYMEAKLNGKPAHVLMDTRATHNFITMEEAKRLGLNVADRGGERSCVTVQQRGVHNGARHGLCGAYVRGNIKHHDFYAAIGYATSARSRKGGSKKSEGTYLASLKVEDHVVPSTEQPPKELRAVPKGKKDVVLHEFEKRQPPRRKVGDQGKLDRGAKPQNVVPCGMVPPKEEKLSTTSKAKGEIIKLIKEGLQRDPLAKELLQLAKSGKTQRYRVKGDLLYTRDGRVYVPKWRDLRKMVIRGSHDTQSTVHPRHRRTYALVTTTYFWPQMKKEVQMCVKTCHVCRQVKGESQADEAKLLDASQVLHDLQRREAEYELGDRLEQGRGVPPKQHYLVKWKGLSEHEATLDSTVRLT